MTKIYTKLLFPLNTFRMGNSLFQFLLEMVAFGGAILLLWILFQSISFIWCKISQMRKRNQIQECLAELEAADRRVWAGGV